MTAGRSPVDRADGDGRPGADRARIIGTLSLVAFAALTVAVGIGIAFPFDPPLLAAARTLDGWPTFWQVMSQTANFPLIAIAIVYVLWLLHEKRHREAVLVILMLAAVTAGSEGVKQLTGRPRPSGSGDGIPGVVFSYPSGHVLEVLTILGLLVVRNWRSSRSLRLRLAFAGIVAIEVALVAIARLALNEHYPTDVLAGFLGAVGALGWYAWLTRPGGWADRPAADPARRSSGEIGPQAMGTHAKRAAL
jgi:membrane-associated phospholipid phosphatase